MKKLPTILYFLKNFSVIVGLVLIWRGIWVFLDGIDKVFFDGGHVWSAIGAIILGLIILYIPDHDLKEIEKL